MSPMMKYTLARLGLFVAAAAVVFAIPLPVQVLLKVLIALLVSAGLALILLRGMRDEAAVQMAAAARRRAEEKQRLRDALAGEDSE